MDKTVRPLNRILVKMVPATEDHKHMMGPALTGLGLQTIDKKKHFDHSVRRGVVTALPPHVDSEVKIGDVVLFHGAAGFTLDGDVMDEGLEDNPLKGEGYRWLKHHELDAVDELMTERLSADAHGAH